MGTEVRMAGRLGERGQSLAKLPLFSACSLRELRKVESLTRQVWVAPGTAVFREGDIGREVFVVVEGTATVLVGGVPQCTVGPGDVLGDTDVGHRFPRRATVMANTWLDLAAVHRRKFSELMRLQRVNAAVLQQPSSVPDLQPGRFSAA
jgi:CRP/FNR family cyclic AMP-dependent transcriptional regulator